MTERKLGHEGPWREWDNALAGERMHHGWLLAGKRGLGKREFAEAAARKLVAEPGVPQPAGDHPDILVLTHLPKDDKEVRKRDEGQPYETKRNIAIDQIRSMQQRLTTRPTLGARRAVIVDPADDMETNAANALLKSLEEPPRGTYFLLIAHRPARLLPTIRSRCRTVRFQPLPDRAVEEMLFAAAPDADAETRAAAVAVAGGSPGAAREFVNQDLGAAYRAMQRLARSGDADFTLRGSLAQALGGRPDAARIKAALDLARTVLAERLPEADPVSLPLLVEAHAKLVRLAGEAPTFNFDTGLLVTEIGTLLASAAPASEAVHG